MPAFVIMSYYGNKNLVITNCLFGLIIQVKQFFCLDFVRSHCRRWSSGVLLSRILIFGCLLLLRVSSVNPKPKHSAHLDPHWNDFKVSNPQEKPYLKIRT
ncbi:Hypothetical protein CINCED_3A012352 [Cinara cedri]|uniref:Uncharacterized protein n=1 Tax=Cinara cedri TaxID=506608 RepID=A0A5E4M891_9HEMI|nr:Hypothetical protein CINCED_3A012352 [Cinara cedri]